MATGATHFSSSLIHLKTKTNTKTFTVKAGPTSLTSSNSKDLFKSGTVKPIQPKHATEAIQTEGYRLLDIRPEWEREKAYVTGSLHVPLFVADVDNGPVTLLKKWVHFGYIGAWTGQLFTTINGEFVPQVEEAVKRDEKLLVACGEGLRSVIAIKMLHQAGYKNLAWLAGGFNRSQKGDFPQVEGKTKLQYATIGGVSYIFLQILLVSGVLDKEN
ncbi:hypothetical protein LUZ60_013055 [Juncus effusus]|nr:hypothetical protein LUZ60_013055 [Juncus effusus]